jgi:outer membrane protein OmpA-like peptidoglycan-associated protein
MGGAFTGLADDINALYWNPAGLALLSHPEVSLMHTAYLADTSMDVISYAQPFGGFGTLAGGVNLFSYGSFPEVTGGVQTGTLSPQDIFLVGGWGVPVPVVFGLRNVMLGASVKGSFQRLDDSFHGGGALSGGALWEPGFHGIRVGSMVDNLGGVATSGRLLPLAWRNGVSWTGKFGGIFGLTTSADALFAIDSPMKENLGLEASAYERIFLRFGWQGGGALGGMTLGGGFRYPVPIAGGLFDLSLDYAAASHGLLGNAHRFQLTARHAGPARVRLGGLRIQGEDAGAKLEWKGPGPAYSVMAKKAGAPEAEFMSVTPGQVSGGEIALGTLAPGSYDIRVGVVDPVNPANGKEFREIPFRFLAPLSLRISRDGPVDRVAWEGGEGPSYDVYARVKGEPEMLRLNEAPVKGSSFALEGMPPGEYEFRVEAVDAGRPGWRRQGSGLTELSVPKPEEDLFMEDLSRLEARLGKVVFTEGAVLLDKRASEAVRAVAELLKKRPRVRVVVEGNADNIEGGPDRSESIARTRAEAVASALRKSGVARARIEIQGAGSRRPLADNSSVEGRSANRRVEFIPVAGENR